MTNDDVIENANIDDVALTGTSSSDASAKPCDKAMIWNRAVPARLVSTPKVRDARPLAFT